MIIRPRSVATGEAKQVLGRAASIEAVAIGEYPWPGGIAWFHRVSRAESVPEA